MGASLGVLTRGVRLGPLLTPRRCSAVACRGAQVERFVDYEGYGVVWPVTEGRTRRASTDIDQIVPIRLYAANITPVLNQAFVLRWFGTGARAVSVRLFQNGARSRERREHLLFICSPCSALAAEEGNERLFCRRVFEHGVMIPTSRGVSHFSVQGTRALIWNMATPVDGQLQRGAFWVLEPCLRHLRAPRTSRPRKIGRPECQWLVLEISYIFESSSGVPRRAGSRPPLSYSLQGARCDAGLAGADEVGLRLNYELLHAAYR